MGTCSGKSKARKTGNQVDKNIFKSQYEYETNRTSQNVIIPHSTASTDNIYFYYDVGKVLGHGQFGTVRIATSRQQSKNNKNKKFAIKTIPKDRVMEKIQVIKRELDIMKVLDHPNIIKFFEIFQDDMYIHYVMEYCEGGDLVNYVLQRVSIDEKEIARIMYKLISAIQCMQQNKIIHRDIKLENVLFSDKFTKRESEVKIVDFGLSSVYNQDEIQQKLRKSSSKTPKTPKAKRKQSFVGTPLYCSPEIVQNIPYDYKIDM